MAPTATRLDPVRPDAASAAACMNMALEDAGLTPTDIDYVNAHGTATVMNDVTEAEALNRAFGAPLRQSARLLDQADPRPRHRARAACWSW